VHWFQSAGRCYFDVLVDGGVSFQLDTSLNDYFDAVGSRARHLNHGYVEYSFRPAGGLCERALQLPHSDVVFETRAISEARVPDRTLCAAAQKWVTLERTAYPDGHAARRSLATPSLTRIDLCKLITVADVETLPGLGRLNLTNPDLGGSCFGTGNRYAVDVQIVFLSGRTPPLGSRSLVHGHELVRYALPLHGCEILSRQGLTRDRRSYEDLDVKITPEKSPARRSLCSIATRATTAMLETANLK
jgi:hypothetical protein